MSIKETVTNGITAAMKSKDTVRLDTLRSIRAGILDFEKSGKGDITPEIELQIVMQQVKKRKEAIEVAEKVGRMEIVAEESKQLAILQEFLPKQLSEEDVRATINTIIATLGTKEFSKVMPAVMKELKGKADGKMM
ncbi:MAG: GatB/YqeY domain-containing protein, partial [Bacteroidota bacterium]